MATIHEVHDDDEWVAVRTSGPRPWMLALFLVLAVALAACVVVVVATQLAVNR